MRFEEALENVGDMTWGQYCTIHEYYRTAYGGTVSKEKMWRSIRRLGLDKWCKKHKAYAPTAEQVAAKEPGYYDETLSSIEDGTAPSLQKLKTST